MTLSRAVTYFYATGFVKAARLPYVLMPMLHALKNLDVHSVEHIAMDAHAPSIPLGLHLLLHELVMSYTAHLPLAADCNKGGSYVSCCL